ncbi:MAG: glycosyltransferase family 4 protein [Porticoccaceae bacterium]
MADRLLIVVNNLSFFISHRLEIGLAAKQSGYVVTVLGPENAEAAQYLKKQGLSVQEIDVAQEDHGLWGQTRFLWAVYRLCREFRPTVCHMITLKTFLVAGVASRLALVPRRIGAVSGLGYFFISAEWRIRISRAIYRPLFWFAMTGRNTEVIFQNQDDQLVLQNYAGIDPAQTHLIPGSGVDLQKFSPQPEPESPVTFVLIGRMLKDKGVMEFVEAARILRESGADARFVLAGLPDETNPASVSRQTLEQFTAEGTVSWIGYCDNPAELIAASHVVVLPSYREGFPRVLIEAAAAGRPAIASDVPGCRHAILDGITGILVPVRDAKSLADAMLSLMQDTQLRLAMGVSARELAEKKYSVDSVVAAHLDIYSALPEG